MRILLLVLIFFILNTIGSFGEPSNWQTMKWINENVLNYSKGYKEQGNWEGKTKMEYQDDIKYSEDTVYVTRKWKQKTYSKGELYFLEELSETYSFGVEDISGVDIGKDGDTILISSDGENIQHTGEYAVRKRVDGIWKTDRRNFKVNLEKAELFTISDEKILKGLEKAFLHVMESSKTDEVSLDDFFLRSTDYYSKGMEKMQEESYGEAVENFLQAISIGQELKDSHYNLGRAYFELGEYDKAIVEFEKVLGISPESQNTHYFLGRSYYAMDEYEKAVEEFETAVGLDGGDAHANYYLGMAYYMNNEYRKAVTAFTKAISMDDSLKQLYYQRGLSYYFLYNYEEALKDLDKYIEFFKDDPNAHYYKGLIHYVALEDDQAINDFTRVLELDSGYERAYYYRGYLYYDKGELENAKKDYEELVKLAPEDKYTKKLSKILSN